VDLGLGRVDVREVIEAGDQQVDALSEVTGGLTAGDVARDPRRIGV